MSAIPHVEALVCLIASLPKTKESAYLCLARAGILAPKGNLALVFCTSAGVGPAMFLRNLMYNGSLARCQTWRKDDLHGLGDQALM